MNSSTRNEGRDTSTAALPPHCRHILGVDPGLQITGYAILESSHATPRVVEAGVLRSERQRWKATDMARRLRSLYDGLVEILEQFQPASVAVEQLFAHYDH